MKTIFLIRHAKSSWGNDQVTDHDRILNERGLRDAPLMGEKLKSSFMKPEKIICSTAQRAKETAHLIGQKWFPEGKIEFMQRLYESYPSDVLNILNSIPQDIQSVALFFHNPTITLLANMLGILDLPNIPTCGVVVLHCDKKDWQSVEIGNCSLENFEYPKKI